MEIIRIYYNSGNDILRQEKVSIQLYPPRNILGSDETRIDQTLKMRLGPQKVAIVNIASSASIAGISSGGDRVVSNIEIVGDFETYDESGPDFNLEWAQKTLGSEQIVKYDMSNLSKIGDTL